MPMHKCLNNNNKQIRNRTVANIYQNLGSFLPLAITISRKHKLPLSGHGYPIRWLNRIRFARVNGRLSRVRNVFGFAI